MEKGDEFDYTYSECIMLINILNIPKNKVLLTSTLIAEKISVHNSDERFVKVMKCLKEKHIIEETGRSGNSIFLNINDVPLRNFIDEQNEINWLVDNYIKKHHNFRW